MTQVMAVIVLTMVTITAGMTLLMFALARAASMRTREEQLHEEVDAEFYRRAILHRSGMREQDVHQGCAEQQKHVVNDLKVRTKVSVGSPCVEPSGKFFRTRRFDTTSTR